MEKLDCVVVLKTGQELPCRTGVPTDSGPTAGITTPLPQTPGVGIPAAKPAQPRSRRA